MVAEEGTRIVRIMVDSEENTDIFYWGCSLQEAKERVEKALHNECGHIRLENELDATCVFYNKTCISKIQVDLVSEEEMNLDLVASEDD